MASWLQNQLRAAEGLLEAVDRTAKVTREQRPVHVPPAAAKLNGQVNNSTRRDGSGGDGGASDDEPTPALPSSSSPKPSDSNHQADAKVKLVKKGSSNIKAVKTEKRKERLSRASSNGSKSGSTPSTKEQAAGSAGNDALPGGLSQQAEAVKEREVSPFQAVADSSGRSDQPGVPEDSSLNTDAQRTEAGLVETTSCVGQLTSQNSIGEAFAWADGSPGEMLTKAGREVKSGADNEDGYQAEVPHPPPSVEFQDKELELTQDTVTMDSQHDHGWVDDFGALELAPPVSSGDEELQAPSQPVSQGNDWSESGVHHEKEGVVPSVENDPKHEQAGEESLGVEDGAGEVLRRDDLAEAGEEERKEEDGGAANSQDDNVSGTEEGTFSEGGHFDPGSRESEFRGSASSAGLHHDLEEAREMAKLSTAAVASREARLQKVCDKLRLRLEELKEENIQLEELLSQADARASGGAGEAESLRAELKQLKVAHSGTESSLQKRLKAKGEELDAAKAEVEKQRSLTQGLQQKLDNLQETTEELLRERQSSEGRLISALRDQLHEMEQRLDEERAAHQASRKSASTRHEQLEADLSESANDISNLHRTVDERSSKIAELEAHVVLLEEEHEQTMAKLRRAEDIAGRERARADANSNDALEAQVAAWKEEVDKGRRTILELEAERGQLQESGAKLSKQVEELEAIVRDARGAANSDLSRRHKEVTDLLYLKQTQLEKMAAEKAAAQLSLEREVMGLREELDKSRRKASSARDPIETYGAEMTPMDTIGAYYTRLANDERLGGAVKGFAKAVDVTAANAMRLMRQYPLARIIFFLYSICIHLFVYVLIQRLQNKILLTEENLPDPGGPQM